MLSYEFNQYLPQSFRSHDNMCQNFVFSLIADTKVHQVNCNVPNCRRIVLLSKSHLTTQTQEIDLLVTDWFETLFSRNLK